MVSTFYELQPFLLIASVKSRGDSPLSIHGGRPSSVGGRGRLSSVTPPLFACPSSMFVQGCSFWFVSRFEFVSKSFLLGREVDLLN